MKRFLRPLIASLFLAVSMLPAALTAAPAIAASAPGNGFRISPPRYQLTIPAGTSQTVSLFVENLANSQVSAQAIVNDFVAGSHENGEPQLILDPAKSAPTNSFKPFVKTIPNTSLQPLERKEIKVTLAIPAQATPGGYYGAIRFIPLYSTTAPANVSLTASVGSLFLITVPGHLTQKLTLASFQASHNGKAGTLFNSGPVSMVTRLHNDGNIHVQPFGKIVVKNTFGKVVATTELNNAEPRGNVLPSSTRRFENALNIKHMFGRYTAIGNFAYGDNGDIVTAKKVFYVIPYAIIIIVLLVLAFLIFGLPRIIRWYNNRVISRSQHEQSAPQPQNPDEPGPPPAQGPTTFQG